MSRIGKLPVPIPQGVSVTVNHQVVEIKGVKGTLIKELHPDMVVVHAQNMLKVSRPSNSKKHKALHGLTRTLLANMVKGVSQGYVKRLEIVGVGSRCHCYGVFHHV